MHGKPRLYWQSTLANRLNVRTVGMSWPLNFSLSKGQTGNNTLFANEIISDVWTLSAPNVTWLSEGVTLLHAVSQISPDRGTQLILLSSKSRSRQKISRRAFHVLALLNIVWSTGLILWARRRCLLSFSLFDAVRDQVCGLQQCNFETVCGDQ